ncbi:hypothetical protein AVEN_97119-1 [Araneus ventricosus]|uniref:STPR domain-containing protein n=1 Tax=Araneus ventricosus TaxID=182803 RepID=A0A4Y2SU31_ARAVE|nr:hypothetical protein AVEN_97119-1 [Araneus ventricosus]
MPKRKRGITGDVASRRKAIRKRERRVVETEGERSRRLSTMAQRGQDRRAEETEEQRNSRLSDTAQRGQERRAEETEEQRNRRLAVMGQRSQQRRAEETEEQRKENTFWGDRYFFSPPGHNTLFAIAHARYLEVTIFALFNSRFLRCLKEKEVTGDASCRQQAIRKREMRVVETDEERNCRLSTMAQRGQDIRAEETEEQNNSR